MCSELSMRKHNREHDWATGRSKCPEVMIPLFLGKVQQLHETSISARPQIMRCTIQARWAAWGDAYCHISCLRYPYTVSMMRCAHSARGTHLHVWRRILPRLRVEESRGEEGWSVHLVFVGHICVRKASCISHNLCTMHANRAMRPMSAVWGLRTMPDVNLTNYFGRACALVGPPAFLVEA
eukprot:1156027-Pelagomonas_calceolata.AAC.4